MLKIGLFGLLLSLNLNGFAAISEFIAEHNNPDPKNYGTEVTFRFMEKNKKGKKEIMSRKSMDNITFTVTNGEFNWFTVQGSKDLHGKLILAPRPASLNDTVVKIEFTYTEKDLKLTQSFSFTLNFKGEVKLDFSGKPGQPGKTYESLGQFIVSNKSNDGDPGTHGENGKDIEATMLQKTNGTDTFYVLTILDVASGSNYMYKLKKDFSKLGISSNGGEGGPGGSGSDGSRKNRFRVDGGNGGNGGNGGDAGKIIFHLDDRAWRIMNRIELTNNPGYGGPGGSPGDGAVHQDDASIVGKRGNPGNYGTEGKKPNLAVPELKKLE